VDKTARVIELIDAYRTRGHLMADTDPLNYRQRRHPDLDVLSTDGSPPSAHCSRSPTRERRAVAVAA
jgi:hypothetical protein